MKKNEQADGTLAYLNKLLSKADDFPLWVLFFPLAVIVFAPYFFMGEGSVFPIHDQLDESILNYVLTARHLGDGGGILPEMMGGINASGLHPSAVLFVPLYRFLPEFTAFVIQYAVCFGAAFLGMYFCAKELTGSSILAAMSAGCFCMLPLYPIYGLSQMGIPLIFYALLRMKRKCSWVSFVLVAFFGLTSHLVYTGYVVLSFMGIALFVSFCRERRIDRRLLAALFLLLGIYVVENHSLFAEILLGQGDYVSHREEMVNYATPFWDTAKEMFLHSGQHAPTWHEKLILPIAALLVAEGICWKRLSEANRRRYLGAVGGALLLLGIAGFYGLCKSPAVTAWKNSMTGFIRYFQVERYYWLYPAGWYLEYACVCGIIWRQGFMVLFGKKINLLLPRLLTIALLLPAAHTILYNSHFYMSVNQINNGSDITGYISWESLYAEDLMQELEDAIGRDMSTYRVVHLGINTAPALMHGFYTVDGYSNNYSLEYKHRFRKYIEKELEKVEAVRLYFDEWGNRCYSFNGATGSVYMLGKKDHITYERLELDMDALKSLGGEYIFSCGKILNAEELGLVLMGYYETEKSYWGIWLYEVS